MVHIYLEEKIHNGISKISINCDLFFVIQKYITLGRESNRMECNYYNIQGFVSKECAEEICEKFNNEKITDFIEAIIFVKMIAEPYIIMDQLTK